MIISGSINVQDSGTTLCLKTIHGSRSKIRLRCRLVFLRSHIAGQSTDPSPNHHPKFCSGPRRPCLADSSIDKTITCGTCLELDTRRCILDCRKPRLDSNYVLWHVFYEDEKLTTTDSWQRMKGSSNPAKPAFPCRTPPQPTGLIKLFELKL